VYPGAGGRDGESRRSRLGAPAGSGRGAAPGSPSASRRRRAPVFVRERVLAVARPRVARRASPSDHTVSHSAGAHTNVYFSMKAHENDSAVRASDY